MTSHNQKVCRDCGEVYWFQVSGGNAPLNNDSTWCVSCAELINNVRKQIKRKFEWKWVISNEYTIDELKEIELAYDTKQLLEHEEKLKQNIYTFPLTVRKNIDKSTLINFLDVRDCKHLTEF